MSNSEAVAVVQGMLVQQRKQDAAEWAAYQEARRKEAQQEKEALQELLWQLDMDSAKGALRDAQRNIDKFPHRGSRQPTMA